MFKSKNDPNVPIYKQIENVVLERVTFLKSKIEEFDSPITEKDYEDHFKSRISGDKSAKALRKYYDELLLREEELGLIRNFDYYYQRNKVESDLLNDVIGGKEKEKEAKNANKRDNIG